MHYDEPAMAVVESAATGAAVSRPFSGKVAIVTGGTRGIGAAITVELARLGAHVAAGFNRDGESATRVRDELTARGDSISIHQGNVGEPEDCNRVVAEVLADQGRVDFLVNNAGITIDKTVRKMSVQDWQDVMRINVSGAFFMVKAVLDHMLERGGGRIVNVSSVIGQTGNIGQANYAASKAAMLGFDAEPGAGNGAQGHHRELRRAWIHRDGDGRGGPDSRSSTGIIEKVPLRRLGRPDEVARVVRFLLEDESSYITGAIYTVNGGMFT